MKNTIVTRLSRLTGVGRETLLAEYLDLLQKHRAAGDAVPEGGAQQDLIAKYANDPRGFDLGTLAGDKPVNEQAAKEKPVTAEDDPSHVRDMRVTPLSKLPSQTSLSGVMRSCTPIRHTAQASVLAFDTRLARHYLRDFGFTAETLDALEGVSAIDVLDSDYLANVMAPFASLLSEEGRLSFAEYLADRDFKNVASTSNFALVSIAQTLANFFHQHYLLNTKLFSGTALRSVLGAVVDGNAIVRRVSALSAHLPYYMLPFRDVTVTPYDKDGGGSVTLFDDSLRLRVNFRAVSVYSQSANSAEQNRQWLDGYSTDFDTSFSWVAEAIPIHSSSQLWRDRVRKVRDIDMGDNLSMFVDFANASFAMPGQEAPSFSLEAVKESNRVCYNGVATLRLPAFTTGWTGDKIITNMHVLKNHVLSAFCRGLKGMNR